MKRLEFSLVDKHSDDVHQFNFLVTDELAEEIEEYDGDLPLEFEDSEGDTIVVDDLADTKFGKINTLIQL
jgi:hypothetical protein